MFVEKKYVTCAHCGLDCRDVFEYDSRVFCCVGCRTVFEILRNSGLEDFYSIRDRFVTEIKNLPASFDVTFAHFDDPLFLKEHVVDLRNDVSKVVFYVPEIYCAACVWLFERLPKCQPGIVEAKVNLSNKLLTIIFIRSQIRLSKIGKLISNFGYTPLLASEINSEVDNLGNQEISRLAVAIFSAMNCMMIAVSLYQGWWSGIDVTMKKFFEIVSALISFPAVFYSAKPIIQRSIAGLRVGRVTLDLPLTIGIVLGYIFSVFSIIFNLGEVYFDSITVLIALLLLARFANTSILARFKKKSNIEQTVFTNSAIVQDELNQEWKEVYAKTLIPGNLCKVSSGKKIPTDGVVISGEVLLDSSILSGESVPELAGVGSLIWGGCLVVEGEAILKVSKKQVEARFYSTAVQLLENIELGSNLIKKIDSRSLLFTLWVFFVAIVSFVYHFQTTGLVFAYEVMLSIFVISCPCALGIAVPFAFTSASLKSSRQGIYFSSGSLIEDLAQIKKIALDKTGTVTEGSFSLVNFKTVLSEDELKNLMQKIYLLEIEEPHPIAKRLVSFISSEFCLEKNTNKIINKVVIPAVSLEGLFSDGSKIKIGSVKRIGRDLPLTWKKENDENKVPRTEVVVLQDGEAKILFTLQDKIREDFFETISNLKSIKIEPYILSGDKKEVVEDVAKKLSLSKDNFFYEMTPEMKEAKVIELGSNTAMVGDGINDVSAIKASSVGISVSGGLELLQKVGGILITDFNGIRLFNSILGARSTMRAAQYSVSFSFFYNIFGTLIAAFGYVSPLLAAILMPISSSVVIAISVFVPKFKN